MKKSTLKHAGTFIGPNGNQWLATGFNERGWPDGSGIDSSTFGNYVERLKGISRNGINGNFGFNGGAFDCSPDPEMPTMEIEDTKGVVHLELRGYDGCIGRNPAPPLLSAYADKPRRASVYLTKHFNDKEFYARYLK